MRLPAHRILGAIYSLLLMVLVGSSPAQAGWHQQLIILFRGEGFFVDAYETRGEANDPVAEIQEAERWFIDTLHDQGTLDKTRDAAMVQQLLTTESATKPGNSLLVLRRTGADGAPGERVGMMGFSKSSLTALEQRLAYRGLRTPLPRPDATGLYRTPRWLKIEEPIAELGALDYQFKHNEAAYQVPGAIAELKKFALTRDAPREWLSLLAEAAEVTQASTYIHSGSNITSAPWTYYAETDLPRMRDHMIEDWGFEFVHQIPNPDMPGSTTYLLRASRDTWVEKTMAELRRRLSAEDQDRTLFLSHWIEEPADLTEMVESLRLGEAKSRAAWKSIDADQYARLAGKLDWQIDRMKSEGLPLPSFREFKERERRQVENRRARLGMPEGKVPVPYHKPGDPLHAPHLYRRGS